MASIKWKGPNFASLSFFSFYVYVKVKTKGLDMSLSMGLFNIFRGFLQYICLSYSFWLCFP